MGYIGSGNIWAEANEPEQNQLSIERNFVNFTRMSDFREKHIDYTVRDEMEWENHKIVGCNDL